MAEFIKNLQGRLYDFLKPITYEVTSKIAALISPPGSQMMQCAGQKPPAFAQSHPKAYRKETMMSTETPAQEIRELAYALWEEAGSPEGREEEFWSKAKEQLGEKNSTKDIDAASAESFPASDPVNHM
jgi:hypothetical protein